MEREYGTLLSLTSTSISEKGLLRSLEDFANSFGWVPSDRLEEPALSSVANGHLIVEHGLETSAVITFLKRPFHYLSSGEKKRLFSLSYNNLIDWHISVDSEYVSFFYNRTEIPTSIEKFELNRGQYDYLRSTAFDKITERKPTTNLPALDSAIIKTISNWKRLLSAELGYIVPNDILSSLFNSIIFTRAAEDQYRFRGNARNGYASSYEPVNTLLSIWLDGEVETISELISSTLNSLLENVPDFVINAEQLSVFNTLDFYTVRSLLNDFYNNKYLSYYEYDFAIISKHALSRIYEGYVSVLRQEENSQGNLFSFNNLPLEERNKSFGTFYTPQYIAKFFSKFIKQQTTPILFKNLTICDPACGSGIFIRTFIESQLESFESFSDEGNIKRIFEHLLGVDVEPNATHATQLSLSLLHLVLNNELPADLNVINSEALSYFSSNTQLNNSFDVVMANPPYVAVEGQSEEMHELVTQYIGEHGKGRVDLYIAFLLIAITLLKPGGFGCFVLPYSFLLAKSSRLIRKLIAEKCYLRCIADLSAVPVFGSVGVYVVLIIFQKKDEISIDIPSATIIRCQEFPGQALQYALDDVEIENNFYNIYKVPQSTFTETEWILLPPIEEKIRKQFRSLPKLGKYLDIRQGIVTGSDSIFIRRANEIPIKEKSIYVPLLKDRNMLPYVTPDSSELYVFYPFVGDNKIEEKQLIEDFPKTWEYLCLNRSTLEGRKSLRSVSDKWWEPIRPRSPKKLLVPKIVGPHLMIVPRYSWDVTGEYAVSRSSYLTPASKWEGAEDDLLKFFIAILNSSVAFWFMSSNSPKYRGGYLMVESKNLSELPVPDLTSIEPNSLVEILELVNKRMNASSKEALILESQIDSAVNALYGLTSRDRRALGF